MQRTTCHSYSKKGDNMPYDFAQVIATALANRMRLEAETKDREEKKRQFDIQSKLQNEQFNTAKEQNMKNFALQEKEQGLRESELKQRNDQYNTSLSDKYIRFTKKEDIPAIIRQYAEPIDNVEKRYGRDLYSDNEGFLVPQSLLAQALNEEGANARQKQQLAAMNSQRNKPTVYNKINKTTGEIVGQISSTEEGMGKTYLNPKDPNFEYNSKHFIFVPAEQMNALPYYMSMSNPKQKQREEYVDLTQMVENNRVNPIFALMNSSLANVEQDSNPMSIFGRKPNGYSDAPSSLVSDLAEIGSLFSGGKSNADKWADQYQSNTNMARQFVEATEPLIQAYKSLIPYTQSQDREIRGAANKQRLELQGLLGSLFKNSQLLNRGIDEGYIDRSAKDDRGQTYKARNWNVMKELEAIYNQNQRYYDAINQEMYNKAFYSGLGREQAKQQGQ